MSDPDDAVDPHVLGPGLLPTPFTADEIRAASGAGKLIRILVEQPDGERFERINRFSDCDDEGATLERWLVAADGGVEGEVSSGRVTWRELQGHAAFPDDRTTVTEETIELQIGRVECVRYDTRDEVPDAAVESFWFARSFPGMPVRFESPTPGGVVRTTVLAVEVMR
ncbi:hypothetical protein BJY17_002321 [Agromyces hippuratus]|uniref:Uncharacterized protein n=1 Tax=Agromyces hippuratus TaxID=286438 RepID=A0A852X2A2_9MICO|nr:hypothetical protein [Agromyces hippuratus]NYG21574.1 hypothetical protein [Agromyces hippuratus]